MKKRAPYVWEPSACHQNQSTESTGSPAWTWSSPRQSLWSPGSALSGPLAFSSSRDQPNCVGRRRRDSLSQSFPGPRWTISSAPAANQPGQNKILKWGRNRRQNAIRDGGSTALFKRDGHNLDADNIRWGQFLTAPIRTISDADKNKIQTVTVQTHNGKKATIYYMDVLYQKHCPRRNRLEG